MTRWLILRRLAPGLVLASGLAAANPWGIGDNQGAAQRQAPGPDWIQGAPASTSAPAPVDRAGSPDHATGASDAPGRAWSDAAGAPAWSGDWRRTGEPATGEPTRGPAPDAPAYRFREDAGGADLPVGAAAGTPAGPAGVADPPARPAPGYRFRGDPPGVVGAGGGGPDAGSYRFRPLTERELERQGQGADPGPRPRRAPPAGPGWPDERSGPWPSR
ncbi:hypothetical protein [uncultured Thiodictyon sp.]|uniref:hypothetical protein n=1 Tax=uncultured Thiodictyon sp. TaxID=1846217 RepID=UPI0025F66BB8|nr:hypothetical protein [uncultured Thiodictyon sp.]